VRDFEVYWRIRAILLHALVSCQSQQRRQRPVSLVLAITQEFLPAELPHSSFLLHSSEQSDTTAT
jgi:hypothetical protein